MFEDAPDDSANWGQVISTDKALYDTDSSDSDNDNPDAKPKTRLLGVEEMKPGASRVQTAKAIKGSFQVHQDISNLKVELERLEARRESDVDRLEKQIQSGNKKIEDMLSKLLKK